MMVWGHVCVRIIIWAICSSIPSCRSRDSQDYGSQTSITCGPIAVFPHNLVHAIMIDHSLILWILEANRRNELVGIQRPSHGDDNNIKKPGRRWSYRVFCSLRTYSSSHCFLHSCHCCSVPLSDQTAQPSRIRNQEDTEFVSRNVRNCPRGDRVRRTGTYSVSA